jgi:SRSO17 transposase
LILLCLTHILHIKIFTKRYTSLSCDFGIKEFLIFFDGGLWASLNEFYEKFRGYFQTKTREVSNNGLEYMKGLLLSEGRRNMNKMAEEVTEINEQALSHFISSSPWKEESLIKKIGEETVKYFSKSQREKSFIIDESGILKEGKLSAGVSRQYCNFLFIK